jgi:hypothetical protein
VSGMLSLYGTLSDIVLVHNSVGKCLAASLRQFTITVNVLASTALIPVLSLPTWPGPGLLSGESHVTEALVHDSHSFLGYALSRST